jgi:hypothetical protein
MRINNRIISIIFLILSVFWLGANNVQAQTTAFTYQGSLKDGATPANGNYDFEFALFDQLGAGGAQFMPTVVVNNVVVTGGIFSVRLDFGSQFFTGANRFLEIRVKPSGGSGGFTPLIPRQPVNSVPYSIKSLNAENATTAANATQLGGVTANQFVQTTDTRLSDARNPLPNSANYIQNTTTQQTTSNFNISGTGNANIFSATTAYFIGNFRMLSIPGINNTFLGVSSGQSNTGAGNSFFGTGAGGNNTTGNFNSFFGMFAGLNNTVGLNNSFFGTRAGFNNATGSDNSFFGTFAGQSNTTGSNNSSFGRDAGTLNMTGTGNSSFGSRAGLFNQTGNNNSFFGFNAGVNTTNGNNSFFGKDAGQANTAGFKNSFFGLSSGFTNTTGNGNSFFGVDAGYFNETGSNNSFFGVSAGINTTGSNNTFLGTSAGYTNTTGSNNTIIGYNATVETNNLTNVTVIGFNAVAAVSNSVILGNDASVGVGMNTFPNMGGRLLSVASSALDNGGISVGGSGSNEVLYLYANTTLNYAGIEVKRPFISSDNLVLQEQGGNVGIGTTTPLDRLQVEGIIRVATLGAAGSTQLCRNASNQISTCSSSLRYKSNINSFSSGLNLIKRLRPVSFNWRADNQADFGLVAEEVARVEPLLVTRNEKGETEGVKYDRLGVVLINAVSEQQMQIEAQNAQINEQKAIIKRQQEKLDKQQTELEALKNFVCSNNPTAQLCQPNKEKK